MFRRSLLVISAIWFMLGWLTTNAVSDGPAYLYGNPVWVPEGGLYLGDTDYNVAGTLRQYDGSGNYWAFDVPAMAANYTWTWPTDDGASGEYLTTDGSGNMDWGTPAGGGSWTLSGSTGSETVSGGDTVTVTAGDGVASTPVTATDTVTINTYLKRSGLLGSYYLEPAVSDYRLYANVSGQISAVGGANSGTTGGYCGIYGNMTTASGATYAVAGYNSSTDNHAYGLWTDHRSHVGDWADFNQLGSAPADPPAGHWRPYFLSTGMYIVDSAGSTVGPLGTGGGGFAHFHVDADSGTPQEIDDNQTLTINGTAPISTVVGATDNVTISHDDSGVAAASYTYTDITVDATGHVTAASSNTLPAAFTLIPKTSSQSKANDNSIAADNTLQFSASASKTYLFKGTVFYTTSAATDFQFSLLCSSAPTAAYGRYSYILPSALTTEVNTSAVALPSGVQLLMASGTSGGWIEWEYTVVCNGAATISFAWAQVTAQMSNTTVLKGSHIEYWKID